MATGLDRIVAFHTLTLGKNEDEKRELALLNEIDYEEYKKRIIGKEKEAEFLVILRALKTLKHIEAYDEEISKITDEPTSDYKVELTDGYKMLIEVKHTDKDAFKISGGNLEKRIAYAKSNDLPLRFAISIKGYWGLFTSEYLKEKHGKISVSDYINSGTNTMNSTWDYEFETCSYMFPKNIQIKSIYAHNHAKGMGISFEPYGELISYELIHNGKRILRVKGKNSKDLVIMMLLEALQDRLANSEQTIIHDNEYTIITDKSSEINIIPEYKFLLAMVEHTSLDNTTTNNDNISIVSTKKDYKYPTLEYIRMCISFLVNKGLDIIVFKGNQGYPFTEYQRTYWTKNSISLNNSAK